MPRRNTATATLGILVRIVAVYGVFWLMQETSALALAWWNQETPQWMWPSPYNCPNRHDYDWSLPHCSKKANATDGLKAPAASAIQG